MTWTGACELEQLVIKPYFGKIGLIRDGFPPADLFVMVDSPEAPISKIYDYTECKRRMEAAGDGKASLKEILHATSKSVCRNVYFSD
ncbi:hypothetical protein ANCCAN_04264 [Ancylostoma caninum]|uniref:Uncharacterized protein n=1 Tax=Ancylostoma caninum TaxID=29170 RepID=A0A368H2Y3_ANCCA|nr:hypothetical protein ANCCAN_04264 [Ancylostoma caninum]